MLVQYFQNRTLGCLPSFRELHRNKFTVLIIIIITLPIIIMSFIGDLLCAGHQDLHFPCILSINACNKEGYSHITERKQAYLKPSYHLVDYPVCSVIIVGTQVIFYCANP